MILDSLGSIRAAQSAFGFAPQADLANGLLEYMNWFKEDPVR